MTTVNDELPEYARCLRLEHAAFAGELRGMLADLLLVGFSRSEAVSSSGVESSGSSSRPSAGSARREIADVACGDGFYSRLLTEIDPSHHVVGIDSSEAFLAAARDALPSQLADRLAFKAGDILTLDGLEGLAGRFEVIFCIDSLESITDHETLLRQMIRLCRPRGIVVVTETDNLHDLIGSWPPEVENILHRLEWEALDEADREGYAFPRYASALLRSAGLTEVAVRSYTFDRGGPLDDLTRKWLAEHFRNRLGALSGGTAEELEQLRRHLHPDGEEYFAGSPDSLLTYLRFCIIGRKPA